MRFVLLLAACSSANSAPPVQVSPSNVTSAHAPEVAPTTPTRVGDAKATGRVTSVRIVAAVDSAAASEGPVYARRDQTVTLYAWLDVEDGGKRTVFTDAPTRVKTRPLAEAPLVELRWNKIEPAVASLSNGD